MDALTSGARRASRVGLALCALLLLGQPSPAHAQTRVQSMSDELASHRSDIRLTRGKLTGPGARILRDAAAGARFVIMGEDHGIAQIPRIAHAIYELLQPSGYDTLAIEVGPHVAAKLARIVRHRDREARLRAYLARYPLSLAFYHWREELAFVARAAALSRARFRLVGIDQELMGASRLLLHQALARAPAEKRRIKRLLAQEAKHYRRAAETGNPEDLFMMTAEKDDLTALLGALQAIGPDAAAPVAALLESRAIYELYRADAYQAAVRRARLMKRTFVSALGHDADKVMVKIGAYHGFRGLGPMRSPELGSFLAELADGSGGASLHVLVLGVRGKQSGFAGVGKPTQTEEFDLRGPDSPLPGVRPLLDIAVTARSWSLFDLRPLRTRKEGSPALDPELERVIFGYDLALLIPEATAATEIP